MQHGFGARLVAHALLSFVASCTLLLHPNDEQCVVDADCQARGLAGRCVANLCVPMMRCQGEACVSSCSDDAACSTGQRCWSGQCLASALVAPFDCAQPVATPAASVSLKLQAQEIVSSRAPSGLTVAACRTQDLACSAPLQRVPDSSGRGEITLNLPWQFSGFLEIRSTENLPLLYYFTEPLTAARELPPLMLIPAEVAKASAEAAGISVDLNTSGVLIVQMHDCPGAAVAGVHFSLEPPGPVPFYLLNGLPNTQATQTAFDNTLQGAVGGFYNVTPGVYLLTAQLGAAGPELRRFNVSARVGSISQVDLLPAPGH